MDRLDVLIVGRYGAGDFAGLGDGVAIHLHPPDESRPPECLERAQAAVGGRFLPEWMPKARALKYFFLPFAGLPPDLREVLRQKPELTVANTHFAADFVAEHVFAVLLRLCRNLDELDAFMRRPALLRRTPPAVRFTALRGKTMGIVGHGHVGRAVEARALAFGMEVLPYTHADFRRDVGEGKKRLHKILGRSRFVVLTLPLTDETQGLIGEEEFAAMGSGALLVNVARGEIVREDALYRALDKGRIGGAAIDTWYRYSEGFFDPRRAYSRNFRRFRNLVMTPHAAYRSDELEGARIEAIRDFVRCIRRGETPAHLINLNAGY